MAEVLCSFEHELMTKAVYRVRPDEEAAGSRPFLEESGALRLLHTARMAYPHLRDFSSRSGFFLENAGRFMIDTGMHLEYSAPECSSPWEAVAHSGALDLILDDLRRRLEGSADNLAEMIISKVNVDYSGSCQTWGAHESYSHHRDPEYLAARLLPHLASRVIYTGAGGFDSVHPGIRFMVSPRIRHLHEEVGGSSTHSRPLFHTRDEALAGGTWRRLHLICGEANCSQMAMLLKLGTTALIVACADLGEPIGQDIALAGALEAARRFANDPYAKAKTRTRQQVSAVEIQRSYLDAVRRVGPARLPAWAPALCDLWQSVLDRHENDPETLTTVLDWRIKQVLFAERIELAGFEDSLAAWNAAVETLAGHRRRLQREGQIGSVDDEPPLPGMSPGDPEEHRVLRREGVPPERYGAFLRLRAELCELDTRYAQIGPHGLFAQLEADGLLDHRVPGCEPERELAARTTPPQTTRAKVRGELVRRCAGQAYRYRCDWSVVQDVFGRRVLDLSDPFCLEEHWTESRAMW